MRPPSPVNEGIVANKIAEVIDLKTYRERQAERRLAAKTAEAFAHNLHYGQTPLSPFGMPVAFFVFLPTWVFTPQFAFDSNKGGSGAA